MADILGYHTIRIGESVLCQSERDTMFVLILFVFLLIPFKMDPVHSGRVSRKCHKKQYFRTYLRMAGSLS